MTLYEYNLLSEKQKLTAIIKHGVPVADRTDLLNNYKLYQLFSFYVEVIFTSGAAAENTRSFSTEKLPEIYFETVDISSLLELS